MNPRYHINVFWSEADAAWIADVPDLPGCSAWGETPDEALKEVKIAIGLWIEIAVEDGKPIPDVRYSPAIYAARQAA